LVETHAGSRGSHVVSDTSKPRTRIWCTCTVLVLAQPVVEMQDDGLGECCCEKGRCVAVIPLSVRSCCQALRSYCESSEFQTKKILYFFWENGVARWR